MAVGVLIISNKCIACHIWPAKSDSHVTCMLNLPKWLTAYVFLSPDERFNICRYLPYTLVLVIQENKHNVHIITHHVAYSIFFLLLRFMWCLHYIMNISLNLFPLFPTNNEGCRLMKRNESTLLISNVFSLYIRLYSILK